MGLVLQAAGQGFNPLSCGFSYQTVSNLMHRVIEFIALLWQWTDEHCAKIAIENRKENTMSTDNPNAAQTFLEAHTKLRALSDELAPYEREYLSIDGLGSAGMQATGVYDYYMKKSGERSEIVAEMKRLRVEAGDEAILAGLKDMGGGELAIQYIQKVPLKREVVPSEPAKEKRRGFFGRFR